jgi:Ca2+-binding RTX toxin-like protein
VATTISISGSNSVDVTVHGRGTVIAGNGNDNINITGHGKIIVGSGHDTLSIGKGGEIWQFGASGHDTINIGGNTARVHEEGTATVTGAFGSATVSGGVLELHARTVGSDHKGGHSAKCDDDRRDHHGHSATSTVSYYKDVAVSGNVTLQGGSTNTEFVGGSGSTLMLGGSGNDTFIGGTGSDTMHGGAGQDVFAFREHVPGGTHVVQDFVSGQDHLFLEGHSLDYLQSHGDITTSGGNTWITLDGGKTTIELQGVTSLKASDVNSNNHS